MAVVAGGLLAAPLSAQAATPVSVATAVAEILADTNALRAAGGLAPLTESTQVDTVAQNWSAQMSANGAMSHNPSYSTQIPAGWTAAGENVATGYDYTTVVDAWHASAGHYANIMGNYNTIGIGYYDLGGQTYFTQDFGNYSTVPSPARAGAPASAASAAAQLPRSGSPFGSFDGATMTSLGKVAINGWDIDPDTASSIPTHIYVDGTFTAAITASDTRSDLAAAFPAYGASHGWSTTLTLSGGNHNICTYAINTTGTGDNTTLGCRTITIPTGSPFGSFDGATMTSLGKVAINGWDIDPDTASSIPTHIYVDGTFTAAITASDTRSDLAAAFPAYGASHGWSTTLTLSGGNHNICTYAINTTGTGDNTTLGCRTITIPTGSPFGSFDGATMTSLGKVAINGWDIDPDTASSIPTHIYVDGTFTAAITASDTRSDLAAAFPAYGASHGWSTTLTLSGGNHNICTYAINTTGTGDNTTLGCRTITIPTGSPFGSFDGATMTSLGKVAINGWDIDPDTASSIPTHIYVDGTFTAAITASDTRSDLAAAFPAYGASHGWSTTLTLSGGNHNICTYAINTTGTGDNTTLGCRTITIPSAGSVAPQAGTTGAMPAGVQNIGGRSFTPVMSEDFTRSAALGSFTSVYGAAWAGYNNVKDTSGHGLYSPDQVLSVQNSTLDWYLHTVNGQPLVAAPMPTGYTGQAYGAYSVRYRTDAVAGYKTAFLLWPASNQWSDGEIDWPDGNLASTIYPASKIVGDPSGAFDKPAHMSAPNEGTGWHVATVTWTPGLVQFYLDGAMIGQTSNAGGVPTKAMRWVLQVETSLDGSTPAASAAGHVQVDWVVQYKQS